MLEQQAPKASVQPVTVLAVWQGPQSVESTEESQTARVRILAPSGLHKLHNLSRLTSLYLSFLSCNGKMMMLLASQRRDGDYIS